MAETKTEKRKASDQQTGANKKQKIEDHTDYKYCRSEENTAAVNNIIKDWLSSKLDEHFIPHEKRISCQALAQHFGDNHPPKSEERAVTITDDIMKDVPVSDAVHVTASVEDLQMLAGEWDYKRIRGMIANYIELRNKDKIDEVDNIVEVFAQSQDENVLNMLVEMIPVTLELTAVPAFKTEAGVRELWRSAMRRIETPSSDFDPESKRRFWREYKEIDSPEWDYDIIRGMISTYIELLNAKKLIRDNDKITDVDGVVRLFAESRDPQVMHMLATMMPATLTAAREMQTEAGVRHIWAVKIGAIDTRGYPAPDSDELFYKHRFLEEYWDKYWDNNVFDDPDRVIQDAFLAKYAKDFVVNTLFKKKSMKICYFHNDTNLWGMGKGYAMDIIVNYLRNNEWKYWMDIWTAAIDIMPDDTDAQKNTKNKIKADIKKLLRKFAGNGGWLNSTANTIHNNFLFDKTKKKEILFNLAPKTKHYYQFKNKAYNLKTGQLEDRTRDMYITEDGVLEYDYPEGETDADYKKEMTRLKKIMAQVQPNPTFYDAFLRWRGYCLTGEVKEQAFVLNIGYTAGNGKSSTSKMYAKAFPVYCKKIGHECFDKGKSREYNKTFSSLANRPYRLLYMEEWGGTQQDTNKIKETVESEKLTVQPLYMEEVTMDIQFKIEAHSNNDPKTGKIDKGLNRRGELLYYSSRFVDNDEEVDEANHVYKKEADVSNLLHDDRYKVGLFRIFAPYAKQYYAENGMNLPEACSQQFAENLAENDPWAEWIDQTFEKTDGGKDDRISKQEMVLMAANQTLPSYDWGEIKCEFQKRGFTYDSKLFQKKKKGEKDKGCKGCFIGIKLREIEE